MDSILAPEEVNALLFELAETEYAGERHGPWGMPAPCVYDEAPLSIVFQSMAAPAAGFRSAERGN